MPTPLVCMAAICAVILATPVLACTDQADAVVALVEHDASVNSRDNDGAPAPHCAVATGSPYVVRLLVNISGVLDEPAHCVNQTAAGVVPVALAAEHVPLNATEPGQLLSTDGHRLRLATARLRGPRETATGWLRSSFPASGACYVPRTMMAMSSGCARLSGRTRGQASARWSTKARSTRSWGLQATSRATTTATSKLLCR